MGRGRSRLIKSGIPKILSVTLKDAPKFGINVHRGKSHNQDKDLIDGNLQRAFDTINKLQDMLGLKTNMLPKIELYYMRESKSAYGDAVIETDRGSPYDARINLYNGMFRDGSYDTAAHEYVHALEAWMIKHNLTNYYDQLNAWVDHEYSTEICRQALVKVGAIKSSDVFDKNIWKTHADSIRLWAYDRYATTQTAETLTRAVQVVLRLGDFAPKYAKAVVESLKEAIQDTYKHMNS